MLCREFCLAFATVVSLSYCFPSHEQILLREQDRSPFSQDFDEDVDRLLNDWHVPGLSIAVVDGNETFTKVCDFHLAYDSLANTLI